MLGLVRKIVAGPKIKTNWNGIQLDLTYITQRIIAMAFPASGFEKTYRNSIDDVSSYFKQVHQGNCLIINVSMRKYDYSLFNGLVKQYFWPDHQATCLTTLFIICNDIMQFMQKSKNGVVAVHCNHGKGRTGTCIISYMLFTRQFKTAQEALKIYNRRRFIKKTYGVDQPCQRRYLDYVQKMLSKQYIQPELKSFKLIRIKQTGLDDDKNHLQISQTRTGQLKHSNLKLNSILKNNSIPLIADIFIEVYQTNWIGESQAIRINYNLQFLQKQSDGTYIAQFKGQNISVSDKKRPRNFTITLIFSQFCNCHKKQSLKNCLCLQARSRQQIQWEVMREIVRRSKMLSQEELDRYVYGLNQEKMKLQMEQEEFVGMEEPIGQVLD